MNAVLYIHGMYGNADESAHYRRLFDGCAVEGLDYQTFTPWETGKEIAAAVRVLKKNYEKVILVAVSIGAYFSMHADIDGIADRAYFISPVVDMERMIDRMMRAAGVSEEDLRAAGEIETPGGTLSYAYLTYARTHPGRLCAPTSILYGGRDGLVPRDEIEAFANARGARLTVMEDGEHRFFAEEQMRFLDEWLKRERLTLRPLAESDREALIALAKNEEIKKTYMLPDFESVEKENAFFGRMLACSLSERHFLRAISLDGDLIGMFNDCAVSGKRVEVGYFVDPAHKGRGYATEALRKAIAELFQRGFDTVTAGYFEGNTASRRVMEKCGMRPLCKTETVTYRGVRHICPLMGISK